MIKKIIASITLFILPVILFTGWISSDNNITSFYYYKGQPFNLTLKTDRIYIRLKDNVSPDRIPQIVSGIREISTQAPSERENKLFVSLNSQQSDASLTEITRRLISLDEIEYASPVFSPDNGTTLIGVENEIIVQFKPNTATSSINEFIQSKGLTIKQNMDLQGGASYVLTVPNERFAIDVANEVYHSGMVNWAEPNLFFTNLLCYTPNDPFFSQQWSQNNQGNNIPGGVTGVLDCDMDVDSAWDLTLGSSNVIVAISDTGIDTLHEDLNCVPGTGFNFFNNTPGGYDDGNHGTACAGIVAAIGDNNLGISGNAPKSRLIPSKWLSSSGSGNYTGAVNATVWSYQKGAWVISNSWGFVGGASSALDQAINDAVTLGRNGKGSLFVVASGNENGTMRYPAISHPNVLVVGGISPCNQRKSTTSCDNETWWGASFGSNLHVVAPCVKIYATDRTGSVGYSTGNYFATFNGTSSATPNVSGVCALVMSADSNQTWDSVRARITRFCEKRGSYTYNQPGPLGTGQWNNEMGYGLVNAYAVVKYTLDQLGPNISHTPLENSENLAGPYTVNAVITPLGSPINPSETKIFWSRDGGPITNSVTMTNSSGNNWTANIPGNGTETEYRYYIVTKDNLNRTVTNPTGAPGNFHSFMVIGDTISPSINHTPVGQMALVNWPASVHANVTDNLGVDSVYVRWRINSGGAVNHLKLVNTSADNYDAQFNSSPGAVSLFDTVYYRIYATDVSASGNLDSTAQFAITFLDKFWQELFADTTFNVDRWVSHTDVQIIDANGVATGTFPHPIPSSPYFLSVKGANAMVESNIIDLGSFTSATISMFESEHDLEIGESVLLEYKNSSDQWDTLHFFAGTNNGFGVFEPFDSVAFELPVDALSPNFKIRFRGDGLEITDEWFFDNICVIGQTATGVTGNNYIPQKFALNQNYPNPFNPSTKISFDIPKQTFVTLKVYDISGREVAKLANGEYTPGAYSVVFDASKFASGVYFYRITAGDFIETKRMMLIK